LSDLYYDGEGFRIKKKGGCEHNKQKTRGKPVYSDQLLRKTNV